MIRAFRYPLKPTVAQARVLSGWIERCRVLYNAALEQRRDAYRSRRKTLSYMDQTRELTALRADDCEWREVPAVVERSALARLQKAFDAFFRRVRARQVPGYPRFRGRDRYDSFDLPGGSVSVEGERVRIPKLGLVRFHRYRPMRGNVLSVTVCRGASRWWVSFACDVGAAPEKRPVQRAVGIDLGLTSFAVLSDGSEVANPRLFRAGEELLARRQRVLARKKRGSSARKRAKLLVAKAHEHIREQRRDFACKLAASLFERFDLVAHEDLNVKGLARGLLAKSVHDVAWAKFIGRLHCKAEEAGKWAVPVDPRGTTQRCSRCGQTVRKGLKEREHRCSCGYVASRDVNAAQNVLVLGISAPGRGALNVERNPN